MSKFQLKITQYAKNQENNLNEKRQLINTNSNIIEILLNHLTDF